MMVDKTRNKRVFGWSQIKNAFLTKDLNLDLINILKYVNSKVQDYSLIHEIGHNYGEDLKTLIRLIAYKPIFNENQFKKKF
jgi:hypothetical protein